MEINGDEVVFDAPPYFRVYKSGRIDRFHRPAFVAADADDASGVASKDVVLDDGTGLSVRLFIPKLQGASSKKQKLPILVYFHGGGFLIESAVCATYHSYVASLAAAAGVLAVSVEYRLAPEHFLPAAYDDCWDALLWVMSSSSQDSWLVEHGDAARVFIAGDSAGGNIVHNVLMRASTSAAVDAPRIEGAILLHPFFGGSTAIAGEPEHAVAVTAKVWAFACPDAADGADDPRINPTAPGAPGLERLGCQRMLVCAAGKDWLAARDRAYHDAVAASAWRGSAAWLETEGEEHVFFLHKPDCDSAKNLMDRVVAFMAGAGAGA